MRSALHSMQSLSSSWTWAGLIDAQKQQQVNEFFSAVWSAQARSSELGKDTSPPAKGSEGYNAWRDSTRRSLRKMLSPERAAAPQRQQTPAVCIAVLLFATGAKAEADAACA